MRFDLLATGGGSAVAAQIANVFVTNDASHAVPVPEQALDNANLKVHEQGTANVNVTNTARVQVAIPAGAEPSVSSSSPSPETRFALIRTVNPCRSSSQRTSARTRVEDAVSEAVPEHAGQRDCIGLGDMSEVGVIVLGSAAVP